MAVDLRYLLGGGYKPFDPSKGYGAPDAPSGYPIRTPMGDYGGGFMGGQPGYPTRLPMSGGDIGGLSNPMVGAPSSGQLPSFTDQQIWNNQDIFASGNPDAIRARLAQTSPGINFSDSDIAMLAGQSRADRGDLVSPFGGTGPSFTSYLSASRAPTPLELQNQQASAAFGHQGDFGPVLRQAAPAFAASALTGGTSIAGQAARDASANNAGPAYRGLNPDGSVQTGGGSMNFLPGGGGNAEQAQGGLFDNFLENLGNLSPAILAGYLGNRQRQDVMGQVGRLNTLGDSLSGPAFMNSITNPYDLQTGQGRTALTQNLQQRGVGGSSFGNQQLGNFDYMRGLGRGDLATRAQAGIAGTQGQLYSDALRGIVGGNAAYNQLLGAGLGASGSLFNRPGGSGSTGNGLFDWLRNLGGVPGGIPTENPYPSTDPGGQGGMDPGNDPSLGLGDATQFDPNIDWGNLYG